MHELKPAQQLSDFYKKARTEINTERFFNGTCIYVCSVFELTHTKKEKTIVRLSTKIPKILSENRTLLCTLLQLHIIKRDHEKFVTRKDRVLP